MEKKYAQLDIRLHHQSTRCARIEIYHPAIGVKQIFKNICNLLKLVEIS